MTEEPIPQDALVVVVPVVYRKEVRDTKSSPVALEDHHTMGTHAASEFPSARFQTLAVGIEVRAVADPDRKIDDWLRGQTRS